MVKTVDIIDEKAFREPFAESIDVGIPPQNLVETDFSIIERTFHATTVYQHVRDQYAPTVSVSDRHFRSFVIDADDDDTNQAGTTESRYDDETEEDKRFRLLLDATEDAFSGAGRSPAYVPIIDMSQIRFVVGTPKDCHGHFKNAATGRNHVDYDPETGIATFHRSGDQSHPDQPTLSEALEEELEAHGIETVGDLAENPHVHALETQAPASTVDAHGHTL